MEAPVVPSCATGSAKATAGNTIIAIANDKMSRESLPVNLFRIFGSPFVEVPTDPPISTLYAPLKYGSSLSTPGMLPGWGGGADCQVAKPVYAMWPFFGFFRVFRARGWNMRHAHSDHRRGRGWCPDASGPRAGGVRRARGGTPALGPRERPAEGAHGVTGLAWGSVYGTRTWLFPHPRTSWSTAPGS